MATNVTLILVWFALWLFVSMSVFSCPYWFLIVSLCFFSSSHSYLWVLRGLSLFWLLIKLSTGESVSLDFQRITSCIFLLYQFSICTFMNLFLCFPNYLYFWGNPHLAVSTLLFSQMCTRRDLYLISFCLFLQNFGWNVPILFSICFAFVVLMFSLTLEMLWRFFLLFFICWAGGLLLVIFVLPCILCFVVGDWRVQPVLFLLSGIFF